jgi:(2Fe-2S) ferredoxin
MKSVLRPLPPGFSGVVMVTVCINRRENVGGLTMASCGARGSEALAHAIEAGLAERKLKARFATIRCLGLCDTGPNVRLAPSNSWFHQVGPGDIPALLDAIESHVAGAGADRALTSET